LNSLKENHAGGSGRPSVVGGLINDILKKHCLTQAEFAEKIGVTFSLISKWKNGQRTPTANLVEKISEIYGIPAYEIVGTNKPVKTTVSIAVNIVSSENKDDHRNRPKYRVFSATPGKEQREITRVLSVDAKSKIKRLMEGK